jgi:hypothetical protein
MTRIVTLRQSPSISRALVLEARAAREGTIAARAKAAVARLRARGGVEILVVATSDPA